MYCSLMLGKYIRKEANLFKKLADNFSYCSIITQYLGGLKSNKFQNGEAQDEVFSKNESVHIFYIAID